MFFIKKGSKILKFVSDDSQNHDISQDCAKRGTYMTDFKFLTKSVCVQHYIGHLSEVPDGFSKN